MASHRRRRSLGFGRCRHRRGPSGQNVAVPWRARRRGHPPVRFGWPADAGPVTTMPDSGGATFRGAGPIRGTAPRPAANHGPGRSHALPGFPGRPRRAARVFRCPPTPVPRTGRRDRQPARQRPRLRDRPGGSGTTRRGRCQAGAAASARPSAPDAFAASRCPPCRAPGRDRRPRPRTGPAPAPRGWPAAGGCAAPCGRARRPASARRSRRSRAAGPEPPRGGRSPGPPAACQRADPPPSRRHPCGGRRGPGPIPPARPGMPPVPAQSPGGSAPP